MLFLITFTNRVSINALPITYAYQTEKAYRFHAKARPHAARQPRSFVFSTTAVVPIPGATDRHGASPLHTQIAPTYQ